MYRYIYIEIYILRDAKYRRHAHVALISKFQDDSQVMSREKHLPQLDDVGMV